MASHLSLGSDRKSKIDAFKNSQISNHMNARKTILRRLFTQHMWDIELLFNVDSKHLACPLSEMERTCTHFEGRFHQALIDWAREKPSHSVLNTSKINVQYQQLYGTDSKFWLRCFQIAYQLADDLCGDNADAALTQLVLLRCTLMLLKSRTRQNMHSGFYPAFRCKTFVECGELHREMDRRHPMLRVAERIQTRFQLAKQSKNKAGAGKRAIEGGCKLFVQNFVKLLEIEYVRYYQQVQAHSPQICEQLQNELSSADAPTIVVCDLLRERECQQIDVNTEMSALASFFTGAAVTAAAASQLQQTSAVLASENGTVTESECDAKREASACDQNPSLSSQQNSMHSSDFGQLQFDQFDTESSFEMSFLPNSSVDIAADAGSSVTAAPTATAAAAYASTQPSECTMPHAAEHVDRMRNRDLETQTLLSDNEALRRQNQSLWYELHQYRERYEMIAESLRNMSSYVDASRDRTSLSARAQGQPREFQRTPIFHGSARVNYLVQQNVDYQRRLERAQYIDHQHAQLQRSNQ